MAKLFRASPDKFAKAMMQRLRANGVRDVEYDAENFRLAVGDHGDNSIYLSNAYDEYLAAPFLSRWAAVATWIQFASAPVEPPKSWDEAAPNVLPRIHSRSRYSLISLRAEIMGSSMSAIPTRPLGDHLALEVALDSPNTIMAVAESKSGRLGKPRFWPFGCRRRSPGVQFRAIQARQGAMAQYIHRYC